MDRRTEVELTEQVRREYEHGGGTIRGIAGSWAFIGAWTGKQCSVRFRLNVRDRYLRGRSSSRRGQFWKRIGGHHRNNGTPSIASGAGSERNYQRWKWPNAPFVRYVRKRKMAGRLGDQELFVPQSYRWGEEAQGGQQGLGRLRRPARVARRRSVRGIPGSRAGASERRGRPQYSIKR